MAKRKIKTRMRYMKHSLFARWWRKYEYKHTTLAAIAIAVFVLALDTALVQALLSSIREFGVAGIVIAGLLFVSFFTAAPAVVLLIALTDEYSPLTIALYAALGSAIGDWIILKIFEDKIGYEIKPLVRKFHLAKALRKAKAKKNREKMTLLGMFAIASPLPDEMGIAMLGIAHLPTISLLVITYLLNAAGILALLLLT